MSTYITALVAGEYHRVDDVYEGKHGSIALGQFRRQTLVEHLDHEALNKVTKQGLTVFEETFDYPYPVRQNPTGCPGQQSPQPLAARMEVPPRPESPPEPIPATAAIAGPAP